MPQNSRVQTILFIFIIFLLGGIGVLWYLASLETQEDRSLKRHTIDVRIIGLRRLRTIVFDTEIFQNPLYQALTIINLPPLAQESPGKENPFATP